MQPQVIQGRLINAKALDDIRQLLQLQPPLSRRQISLRICSLWNWQTDAGVPKDIAARSLLRKLEQRNLIVLPPVRCLPMASRSGQAYLKTYSHSGPALPPSESIQASLAQLAPISISIIQDKSERRLLAQLLQQHHYLGWNRPVGESIAYWAHDRRRRLLAVCLWGAAAWKVAPRDQWLGWSHAQRSVGLKFIANNQRFLLLPSVQVPHLGSHLLAQIQHRIRADWQRKYCHDLLLLESFVQIDRFHATVYRAANWICVGQTQGRSRQDRFHRLDLPAKSIWLQPLVRHSPHRLHELTANLTTTHPAVGLRLPADAHP